MSLYRPPQHIDTDGPGTGDRAAAEPVIAGVPASALRAAKRPGPWLTDTEPLAVDPHALRQGRLARLRAMMRAHEYAGLVLFDPYNQRYATGSRNMFGYFLRNSSRYFFVPVDGPIVLFEYPQSAHVSEVLDTVAEVRTSKVVWSSVRGADGDTGGPFADEIAELMRTQGGTRVGLDRCFHGMALALEARGLEVVDCMQDLLATRAVKTPEEVSCLVESLTTCEAGTYEVLSALRPGVSEQELFAAYYGAIIAGGGEMVETRLLSSGTRTNPWFSEASGRRVRPRELVAFDTDTIGNYGYYSDFSRTFFCGPGKPSGEQKTLYQLAYEQVQHNVSIIAPGLSFRELSERAWRIPERYLERRYTSVMHGCGMHGETPFIAHIQDYDRFGVEGRLEPGMVLCVESYIGEVGGAEGVKLEEEVLVTERGGEVLSKFPYDDALLG
ncbi:M24 family metallopeptidase [Haliangium sp.]|uniref:M24 family metallopeptidase n=1 Tax=Haliangium sp. TaxID=2663208 RepID=UPI003D10E62F